MSLISSLLHSIGVPESYAGPLWLALRAALFAAVVYVLVRRFRRRKQPRVLDFSGVPDNLSRR